TSSEIASLPMSCNGPPTWSSASRSSLQPSSIAIDSAIAVTRAEWPRACGSRASIARLRTESIATSRKLPPGRADPFSGSAPDSGDRAGPSRVAELRQAPCVLDRPQEAVVRGAGRRDGAGDHERAERERRHLSGRGRGPCGLVEDDEDDAVRELRAREQRPQEAAETGIAGRHGAVGH